MTRRLMIFVLILASGLFGQAAVESAVATGAASGATGSMQKAGEGIKGVLDKAVRTLNSADARVSDATSTSVQKRVVSSSSPVVGVEKPNREAALSKADPDQIREGMTRAELMAAAGRPAFSVLESGSVERCSFDLKAGGAIEVTLLDGTVTRVKRVQ